MAELALPVVVCAIIFEDKILLLKRKPKGDTYDSMWSLPGGKIEKEELLSEAAIREVFEETGLKCDFSEFLGVVSENLIEGTSVKGHFLLNFVKLDAPNLDFLHENDGKLRWFDLNEINSVEKHCIPSDFLMIKDMLIDRKKMYYDCIVEKKDKDYILKKFN